MHTLTGLPHELKSADFDIDSAIGGSITLDDLCFTAIMAHISRHPKLWDLLDPRIRFNVSLAGCFSYKKIEYINTGCYVDIELKPNILYLTYTACAYAFTWKDPSSLMAKMRIRPAETMFMNKAIASSSWGEYVSKMRCAMTAPLAWFSTSTWIPLPRWSSVSSNIWNDI